MTSHLPSSCCAIGNIHEGTPTGESIRIASRYDGYLASPVLELSDASIAILYLPDVMGLWQNSRLMADRFAANGYLTLAVDIYDGDPVPVNPPADFDIISWLAAGNDGMSPHTEEIIDPIVLEAIKFLRQEHRIEKIFAVGYCLGAKYLLRHFKTGFDVGYIAHPSFVTEAELASLSGPLSVAAADADDIFTPTLRHRSEEILRGTGQVFQITLYSHVEHGFAVRCDLSNALQKFAREQALQQAVAWFEHFRNKND